MKKIAIRIMALSMALITLGFTACAPRPGEPTGTPSMGSPSATKAEPSPSASTGEATPAPTASPTEAATPSATPTPDPTPAEPTNFEKYQSNIACSTGHNALIKSKTGKAVTETYRGVFPVEEHGRFAYKFYYSNNIDSSSWAFANYRDMPTSPFKIESAWVYSSKYYKVCRPEDGVEKQAVTFGGETSRSVEPKECFWSDEVMLDVPEGRYLVFEWTVTYTKIPGTITAETYPVFKMNDAGNFSPLPNCSQAPMPDLFGCDRGKLRVGFLGDSITEGTGTVAYKNEFWVAQIAEQIGKDYSLWNLGLDSARVNDVVTGTSFLEKAKQVDVLCLAIGINDVCLDIYSPRVARSAQEVFNDIRTVATAAAEAGCQIIVFSLPPFEFSSQQIADKWLAVNKMLKDYAEEKGYDFFDFAACLASPDAPTVPLYGGHPNGKGCKVVADAFVEADLLAKYAYKK